MRITTVASARKSQGDCESCGEEIKAGEPYRWMKARYGLKRSRHLGCPTWRASEMTGSDKLAQIYAAMESVEDVLGDDEVSPDDLRDALENAANEIREAAESYRESASNIEDGFGHETSTSQELNDKGDEVEAFADEVESAAGDIADLPDEPDLEDLDEDEMAQAQEEFEAELQEARDNNRDMAESALANCPV